ncbi:ArsC family reductase [Sediminibacterium roseum]|uniref:ArsC family reductase n=1 Tax=Sediminibacterium roseum TaxID=1978412 RepID=A0ABW9ZX22_9BACT|nr:ArsC family reductase [Sediminibacterium roseum]NCI51075.1 ArsC family reductase [Sediminibacterium roseum]
MYTVYGIPNCDTVKKVRDWLDAHKIKYDFHNYKTDGITAAKLKTWCGQVGWETILNKKSTTWRELDAKTQATINNEKKAIELLVQNTSAIKRPVIEKAGKVITVGFNAAAYEELF